MRTTIPVQLLKRKKIRIKWLKQIKLLLIIDGSFGDYTKIEKKVCLTFLKELCIICSLIVLRAVLNGKAVGFCETVYRVGIGYSRNEVVKKG